MARILFLLFFDVRLIEPQLRTSREGIRAIVSKIIAIFPSGLIIFPFIKEKGKKGKLRPDKDGMIKRLRDASDLLSRFLLSSGPSLKREKTWAH